MATKTVWWDKDNKQHEGYIQGGKTYTNQEMTERVPVGATVQTNGGTFKMTDNGGIPTAATVRNNYINSSNEAINAYKAAGQIQKDRINAATNAAISEMNRQKQIAGQNREDADRAAREAYEAAANPFGALEEQRVRMGLDESGYAESSKLRLASDYAAQQVANLRALNEQIQALDVQIAQAKASGQYELANMLEAREQNVMQQKLALEGNIYSGDMQAMAQAESVRQFNEQMAAQREQLEAQKEETARQNKYNLALMFLENGKDASFVAETLGIPQKDVDALTSMIRADKATKASGGGSGSGGAKKTNKYYAEVAGEAYDLYDEDLEELLDRSVIQGKISDSEAIQIFNDIIESREPATSGGGIQAAIKAGIPNGVLEKIRKAAQK